MRSKDALSLICVAMIAAGCSSAPSSPQQLLAPTLGAESPLHDSRAGGTNRAKSERWTFLCIDNHLRGDAKYEATFRDIYGRSLDEYCNRDSTS